MNASLANNRRSLLTTRKEIQCTFRLLNNLVSNKFLSEFACFGNLASRALLETGNAGNDEYFWSKVQNAFVDNKRNDFDDLEF